VALKLAVLLSGGGTTLQNIIDRIEAGELDAEAVCVISSRHGVKGLARAQNHGIPAYAVAKKDYAGDFAAFNRALWAPIREHGAELVVLAGFMSLIEVPPDYENRIINVHPALIPSFCGKGMYGRHVHEAVLEYGVKVSGATVHFVDAHYDNGPIILQECVPVENDDTPDTLAERVQALERELYPRAIALIASERVEVEGRRVRILPE
jgi:phosphoribosylglycinamide formyltransferase-1